MAQHKSGLDPENLRRFQEKKRQDPQLKELFDGIRAGDRKVLSQAITLVESTRPDHQQLARELVEQCLPYSGNSIRVGITGVPGVGKSTFIEALGMHLVRKEGKKLAVLAIDPSSNRTKGSILGDKTRMEELSREENAFIRPTATGGSLGGVARRSYEAIVLCEAAGFDTIFVETVGVGQSETAVYHMVDFFLLLMLAGAGDELQGIKKGIMEMADAVVINKADGDNLDAARKAELEYRRALHLFPLGEDEWQARTATCSALEKKGMSDVWQIITEHHAQLTENGFFQFHRKEQAIYRFHQQIDSLLKERFFSNSEIEKKVKELEKQVREGNVSAYLAAEQIVGMAE